MEDEQKEKKIAELAMIKSNNAKKKPELLNYCWKSKQKKIEFQQILWYIYCSMKLTMQYLKKTFNKTKYKIKIELKQFQYKSLYLQYKLENFLSLIT